MPRVIMNLAHVRHSVCSGLLIALISVLSKPDWSSLSVLSLLLLTIIIYSVVK